MDYLKECFLIAKYCMVSNSFCFDIWFNSVIVRNTLYDFNLTNWMLKFISTQEMVYLGEYSLYTWKEYVFGYCWVECSVNEIELVECSGLLCSCLFSVCSLLLTKECCCLTISQLSISLSSYISLCFMCFWEKWYSCITIVASLPLFLKFQVLFAIISLFLKSFL